MTSSCKPPLTFAVSSFFIVPATFATLIISRVALCLPASDTKRAPMTKKNRVRNSGPYGRGDDGVLLINRSRKSRGRRRGRMCAKVVGRYRSITYDTTGTTKYELATRTSDRPMVRSTTVRTTTTYPYQYSTVRTVCL